LPPEVRKGTSAATGVSRLGVASATHLRVSGGQVRGQGVREVGGERQSRDGLALAQICRKPMASSPLLEYLK